MEYGKGVRNAMILLKLVESRRCNGCGSIHRLVSKNSHLCLWCLGLKLDVDNRKKKLETTLNQRFAEKVLEFQKEFQ
jgi:hypothetical protein